MKSANNRRLHDIFTPLTNIVGVALCAMLIAGCGHSRAIVSSVFGVFWVSSSEYLIEVRHLPLKDWPKLQKFTELSDLSISENLDPKSLDKCLQTLSQLKLPRLRALRLECSPTDDGLLALTNLSSIVCLDLYGKHITDSGVRKVSANLPLLRSISFNQCTSITINGFLSLTNAIMLRDVLLNVEKLNQQEVERVIREVSQVTYWGIDRPSWGLALQPLKQLKDEKDLTIVIHYDKYGWGIDEVIKSGYEHPTDR